MSLLTGRSDEGKNSTSGPTERAQEHQPCRYGTCFQAVKLEKHNTFMIVP